MKIIRDYVRTKSTSMGRYCLEQALFFFLQAIPSVVGIVLRGLFYRIIVEAEGVFCIEENVQICHAANLKVGKNVFIGRNACVGASGGGIVIHDNAVILDNCYLNVFNYYNGSAKSIVIRENVVLATGCVIHGHSGVDIGENTIVGPQSVFVTGNHGEITPGSDYRFAECSTDTPIRVLDNVWIGARVVVLPGVTIGSRAVIGAGSVVTEDVPSSCVYAGNPARMIRRIE